MKKKLFVFIFLMLLLIPKSSAYSKDLIKVDENVTVKNETIEGTSFNFGNSVDIESNINGILFQFANNAVNKSNQDYLFLFSNNVTIDKATFKDGFIFGNTINIDSSNIQRDAYVFGNNVNINNNIGRDLKVFAADSTINGVINGNLFIEAENITISDGTVVKGTLTYPKNAKIFISKDAQINKTKLTDGITIDDKEESYFSKLQSKFISFLNLLVVGIVFMLVFRKKFENIILSKESIFQNLGIGLLSLLFIPIASILLFTTIVGFSLGVILIGIYILLIYTSTLITSYSISNYVLNNKIKNKYLILIIGLSVIYLLKLVPVLGTIVSLICLLYGLGFVTNSFIKRK